MLINDCLIKAYNSGAITEETKNEILESFANGKDIIQAINDFKSSQFRKKYIKTLIRKKEIEIIAKIDKAIENGQNPADAITSFYTKGFGTPAGHDNVEYTALAIRGYLERKFAEYMPEMATRLGVLKFNQDKELIDDVARALADNVGLKTDRDINPRAREIAKAWEQMSEEARKMYNDNGGDIGKIDNWMLPQSHDKLSIYNAGYEKWLESAKKTFSIKDHLEKQKKLAEAEIEIQFAKDMRPFLNKIENRKAKIKESEDYLKALKSKEKEFKQKTNLFLEKRKLKEDTAPTEAIKAKRQEITEKYATKRNEMQGKFDTRKTEILANLSTYKTEIDEIMAILPQKKEYIPVSEDDVWKSIFENITDTGTLKEATSTGGKAPTAIEKIENKIQQVKKPTGISSALYNKRTEARVMTPIDIESYIEYQKAFGNPDYFQTMLDHMRGISQDIALMKVISPNPQATHDMIKNYAKQVGELSSIKEGYLDAVFNVANGKADTSLARTKSDLMLEGAMGALRGINTATMLGSATLSSVTDIGGTMVTAGLNNVSMSKILSNAFGNMFDLKDLRGLDAMRAGLTADIFNSSGVNSKWSETGTGWTQKAGEYVLRASGLNNWTNSIKVAFETEFSSLIASNIKKELKDLPTDLAEQFRRYGITQSVWDKLRDSEVLDVRGVKFIDPDKIKDKDAYFKLISMIKQESDYAVLMGDYRTRAITTAGKEKGTIGGELARMTTQFKSFPITFLTHHLGRALKLDSPPKTRAAYATKMLVASTVLGYVAMTLKDLASGKEPREFNLKTAGAAVMQGGGLGLFGDVFFTDTTKYGNSFWSAMISPSATRVEDLFKLTVGNLHEYAKGKDTNFGSEATRLAQSYIPAQNLWYSKLLTDRLIFDNIKGLVDDKYESKLRKQQGQMMEDFGQEYYWKPYSSPF
jgi:hypothetical protein